MSDSNVTTVASYTVVRSLGTPVARTAHVTSSVLVDLDENGAVAGIEAIGTSVGVSELLDVIRWLRAPALSAPSEPHGRDRETGGFLVLTDGAVEI